MIETSAVLQTSGDGYWSKKAKCVTVTGIALGYINEEASFGELCVYFDTATWDVKHDGLIYTDKRFKSELKDMLTQMGLDADDVSYSEQGMQGDEYVSCDVGKKFIESVKKLYIEEFNECNEACNS